MSEPEERLCLNCQGPLPEGSLKKRKFCCADCGGEYKTRETDPTPEEIAERCQEALRKRVGIKGRRVRLVKPWTPPVIRRSDMYQ